ncbi:MAG: amidohydrolase [Deltaproteobacteria bacterium RIFOXYD12_FULL_57_12]|nr:MAG: amidohydrolase [Deltaproteobacteria bacterium RIFOXYD12_FULL_57_12]
MDDLLIINAMLLPLTSAAAAIIHPGFVRIKGDRILQLGAMVRLDAGVAARRTLDAAGMVVMPGLINGHTHAPMTLFRGLADDLPLMTWLQEHIFPAEARWVTPAMVYWCAKLAAAEMLRAGTTCVADGYFHEEAVAAAFLDAGLRAVAAQGIIDFPAPGVADPADNVDAAARFIENWRKDTLIRPAAFCHSPYTCSPATLQQAKAMTRRLGTKLFIHLAETREEADQCQARFGLSPVRHLDRLGVLDSDTVCVHCVWLDNGDLDILAARGAAVITCPRSNMKLAVGTAPLTEMLSRNIPVGLGTDSCASNNALDLFNEMGTAARLHKVHSLTPTTLPARQVLQLATRGGAQALGLEAEIGSLTPGKKADLLLLDCQTPELTPFHHQDLLVYAASGHNVRNTIINGRLVMENRTILSFDLEETMHRVRELADRLNR